MTAIQIACLSLLFIAGHDPLHGDSHHAHVDDSHWKKPTPPSTPVYVGAGDFRYRWDSEWLQLPEGRKWLGNSHGCLVFDAQDRLYLSADSGPAVLVFAPDGKLERSFGEDWGPGLHGIAIVEESEHPGRADSAARQVLYLAHTARQEVIKTTLKGEVLQRIGPPPASKGLYPDPTSYKPTSVAVAPDGTIFIADGYGLSWIHRYDKHGVYLDSFGGRGAGPEHLNTPHGLWLDQLSDPATLLVADRENHRLARFSLEGEFLAETDPLSGLLRRPCHVQFSGRLGVVADLAGRTTLINAELELVAQLGDNPDPKQRAQYNIIPDLWRDGIFLAPHCAQFNRNGDLFVLDWNVAGRLTRLQHVPQAESPR